MCLQCTQNTYRRWPSPFHVKTNPHLSLLLWTNARAQKCWSSGLLSLEWTSQDKRLVPRDVPHCLDYHWLSAGTWLLLVHQKVSKSKYFTSHAIFFFSAVLSLLFLPGRYELDWLSFLICMISCSCGRGVTKAVFFFSTSSGASGGRRNKTGSVSLHRGALQCWDCLWCSLTDDESWLLSRGFFFFFFATYGRSCWTEEPYDAEPLCINVTSSSCRHMSADNWPECCTQTDSTELQKWNPCLGMNVSALARVHVPFFGSENVLHCNYKGHFYGLWMRSRLKVRLKLVNSLMGSSMSEQGKGAQLKCTLLSSDSGW